MRVGCGVEACSGFRNQGEDNWGSRKSCGLGGRRYRVFVVLHRRGRGVGERGGAVGGNLRQGVSGEWDSVDSF